VRACFLLLSVLLGLAFAPAPLPRPANSNALKRLQGTWLAPGGLEARFEGDRLSYYRQGKFVNAYRVTPGAPSNPPSLLLQGVGGGAADGRTYCAIYRIEGDRLTTCANAGGLEHRPRAFDGPGKGSFTEVYTRKKRQGRPRTAWRRTPGRIGLPLAAASDHPGRGRHARRGRRGAGLHLPCCGLVRLTSAHLECGTSSAVRRAECRETS
jgi:uncharacterized protein (TIGR03067 family)